MSAAVVVLVPIYRPQLELMEQYALDKSLWHLQGRDVHLIAPASLPLDYYRTRYPQLPVDTFAGPAFESIPEYSRMLLSETFYDRYAHFEFMLIMQTDAILLKDDLDFWCTQPFDYVGAPWPKPFELFVNTGRFEGNDGRHVRCTVGNGGLSLRRISKCASLLREFSIEIKLFQYSGSSEDLFFSTMGTLSNDFVLPNEVTASRFSMEGRPAYYQRINGGHLPMGAHAWMKNEPNFWRAALGDVPAIPDAPMV
jgi:hypothetical protein